MRDESCLNFDDRHANGDNKSTGTVFVMFVNKVIKGSYLIQITLYIFYKIRENIIVGPSCIFADS